MKYNPFLFVILKPLKRNKGMYGNVPIRNSDGCFSK